MARAYALTADENGRIEEAATAYEASLLVDPTDLEATVNLVVLYWQVADHTARGFPPMPGEFRAQAARRLAEILDCASERFPHSAELGFWKSYIATARVGRPFEPSECRRLLREYPYYLEPAFVVFEDSEGTEAEAEAMRLLADYSEQPTARGRYITSIISGTLARQRFCRQSPLTSSQSPAISN